MNNLARESDPSGAVTVWSRLPEALTLVPPGRNVRTMRLELRWCAVLVMALFTLASCSSAEDGIEGPEVEEGGAAEAIDTDDAVADSPGDVPGRTVRLTAR